MLQFVKSALFSFEIREIYQWESENFRMRKLFNFFLNENAATLCLWDVALYEEV